MSGPAAKVIEKLEPFVKAIAALNPVAGAAVGILLPVISEVVDFLEGRREDMPSVPKQLRSRAALEKAKLRAKGAVL